MKGFFDIDHHFRFQGYTATLDVQDMSLFLVSKNSKLCTRKFPWLAYLRIIAKRLIIVEMLTNKIENGAIIQFNKVMWPFIIVIFNAKGPGRTKRNGVDQAGFFEFC